MWIFFLLVSYSPSGRKPTISPSIPLSWGEEVLGELQLIVIMWKDLFSIHSFSYSWYRFLPKIVEPDRFNLIFIVWQPWEHIFLLVLMYTFSSCKNNGFASLCYLHIIQFSWLLFGNDFYFYLWIADKD